MSDKIIPPDPLKLARANAAYYNERIDESKLPSLVQTGVRRAGRSKSGAATIIYSAESRRLRQEAIDQQIAQLDETRQVGVVREFTLPKSGRTNQKGRTVIQKWDGAKWVTLYGDDAKAAQLQYAYGAVAPPEALKEQNKLSGVGEPVGESQSEPQPVNIKIPEIASTWETEKKHFRYPLSAIDSNQDFIQFGVIKYQRQGLTGGPVGTNQTFEQNKQAQRILGTVTLPIPSNIGDNNVQNYGPGNLNFLQEGGLDIAGAGVKGELEKATNAAKNLLSQIYGAQNDADLVSNFFANQAIGAFGGNINLNQLLARREGVVINPNMELLFTGPGLRNFTFQFKFTPRSSKEGDEIRQIIRVFKRHSAPKQGAAGRFLKTPDIFQIRYLSGQKNHPFLNRFKLCALANMQVNYTGDGVYATYDNGTPVSMIMTLNFQELTPVYAEDYNSEIGGVGY